MKKYIFLLVILIGGILYSCDMEYLPNPNEPKVPPSYTLLNRVQKTFMNNTRDEWFSGRMSLLWVQYWTQVNYTDEDRYKYRETTNNGGWNSIYKNAQDMKDMIYLNVDEATKGEMSKYGPNENQIAAGRIMLVYIYLTAVQTWGDVPYWSYGNNNETFQANCVKDKGIMTPVYAKQEVIYPDLLKELKEASEMITGKTMMKKGDNFFNGDTEKWKKFANSLRLRIANRIKGVNKALADTHIEEAVKAGIMEENEDNAGVKYATDALNAAPMYRAFYVKKRKDFGVSLQFVELLQGRRGPFKDLGEDPRLDIFVADNTDGLKVGMPLTPSDLDAAAFKLRSFPGKEEILKADYTEFYMEYAEVCFIQSELKGWHDGWYKKGIRASMERWGVPPESIDAYIAKVPVANEENVLTQKYIALYMQPHEAWSEYRRTGYPKTFIKPNEKYTYKYDFAERDASGNIIRIIKKSEDFKFTVSGATQDVKLNDLPCRVNYLLNEESVNETNVKEAASSIGGDKQTTKLWFQPK